MPVHEVKQMMFYGIRWSAIFAGVVVGIAVQAMLGLLGLSLIHICGRGAVFQQG